MKKTVQFDNAQLTRLIVQVKGYVLSAKSHQAKFKWLLVQAVLEGILHSNNNHRKMLTEEKPNGENLAAIRPQIGDPGRNRLRES